METKAIRLERTLRLRARMDSFTQRLSDRLLKAPMNIEWLKNVPRFLCGYSLRVHQDPRTVPCSPRTFEKTNL